MKSLLWSEFKRSLYLVIIGIWRGEKPYRIRDQYGLVTLLSSKKDEVGADVIWWQRSEKKIRRAYVFQAGYLKWYWKIPGEKRDFWVGPFRTSRSAMKNCLHTSHYVKLK